ncbi:Hypothetical protein GLP15_1553 [Giardia lamblia P15]|uniref:Uncharacterized protein n=1 Tax=Giardia intestinalis (strain P15) TaxID=658858 RepID=E1EXJ5_GIAIA|nr:Hypothetical protein GLP15_1553 [Giardia lamblia P15]
MLSAEEAVLYDRQLRAFGASTQQLLSRSVVVIELRDQLFEELAKTCAILGFHTLICFGQQRNNAFDLRNLNRYCTVKVVDASSSVSTVLIEAVKYRATDTVYLLLASSSLYDDLHECVSSLGTAHSYPQPYFLSFTQEDPSMLQVSIDKKPDDSYTLSEYCEIEDMCFLADMLGYFLINILRSRADIDAEHTQQSSLHSCTLRRDGLFWKITNG